MLSVAAFAAPDTHPCNTSRTNATFCRLLLLCCLATAHVVMKQVPLMLQFNGPTVHAELYSATVVTPQQQHQIIVIIIINDNHHNKCG